MAPDLISSTANATAGSGVLQACAAIGDFIEFWGFKRNHGRVWALLYLLDRPLTAVEIQTELDLSKGAVSMIAQELEHWRVIHRHHDVAGRRIYVAETDLIRMIGRVVREREVPLMDRIRDQLENASKEVSPDSTTQTRLRHLVRLTQFAARAALLFAESAKLDATAALRILRPLTRR